MKHARASHNQKSALPPRIPSNEGMNGARSPFEDKSSLSETRGSIIGRNIEGVIFGKLVEFAQSGEPLVDFPANPLETPLEARSLVALNDGNFGQEVALLFESRDVRRPIIIGLLQKLKRGADTK